MFESLILNILVFLYAIVAPGVSLAWLALRDRDPLVLITIGLTLGIFAMPLMVFVLAVLLGTYFSAPLILSTATAVLLVTFMIDQLRKRKDTKSQ